MSQKKSKIVIDTNVLISGIIVPKGYPHNIFKLLMRDTVMVIMSKFMIDELEDVLNRKTFKKLYRLSDRMIKQQLSLIIKNTLLTIPVESKIKVRDKKDQPILETALAAKADYLITGDKDLLVLKQKFSNKFLIVTPREYVLEYM